MQLETERLLLRPIVAADAEDIYAYSKNANVGIHAGWKPHADLAETEEVMRTIFLDQPGVFGIVLKENGRLIGTVGLIKDPKREYEKVQMLGYALAEEYWGVGIMSEAVQAVLAWGFNDQQLEMISAYCYPYNNRSVRVLQKAGFKWEGLLRRAEKRFDGAVLDHECYALSAEEYREQKEHQQ